MTMTDSVERVELMQLRLAEDVGRFGSYSLDMETRVYTWTPGLFALLGLDPAATTAGMEVFMDFIPAEDKEAWLERANRRLIVHRDYVREYRMVVAGQDMWVRARAKALTLDGRKVILGVIVDITESYLQRQEIAELNNQLMIAVDRQADVIDVMDAASRFH